MGAGELALIELVPVKLQLISSATVPRLTVRILLTAILHHVTPQSATAKSFQKLCQLSGCQASGRCCSDHRPYNKF
jgi:hypothetical protein